MKILQLTFASGIGGTERNLVEFEEQFIKKGHEVITCTLAGEGAFARELQRRQLPYKTFGITSLLKVFNFINFLKWLKHQQFNVAYIFGFKMHVIALFFLKLFKIPVIISGIRSTEDWRKFYHVAIERLTYPMVNGWIAVSFAVKQAYVLRERVRPEKVVVIPNGINLERYSPEIYAKREDLRKKWKIERETFVIGYVANLKARKGHEILITASKILKEKYPNFRIFFIGADQYGGIIQKIIKDQEMERYITLTGYVADIREIVPVFDLYVTPTLEEGMPMSMLEAMALRCPIVATPIGGIPEVIKNGVNGIIIPPEDPVTLSQTIFKLITDMNLREKLAKNARETIEKEFALDEKINKQLEYFFSFFQKDRTKKI